MPGILVPLANCQVHDFNKLRRSCLRSWKNSWRPWISLGRMAPHISLAANRMLDAPRCAKTCNKCCKIHLKSNIMLDKLDKYVYRGFHGLRNSSWLIITAYFTTLYITWITVSMMRIRICPTSILKMLVPIASHKIPSDILHSISIIWPSIRWPTSQWD